MDAVKQKTIIAEFMELPRHEDTDGRLMFEYYEDNLLYPQDLEYDTSLDWLMRVILKIADDTEHELVIGYDYSYWNRLGDNPLEKEFDGYGNGTEALFEAVVEFLEWLKSTKQN